MNKKIRQEILTASDEQIEDAVKYADPMVLRGLLYQLTGDEEVAGTPVANFWAGFVELQIVSDPAAIALLQTRAAAFLKGYRDAGAGDIDYGPPERLRKSIGLTAGEEIPEDEFEMWFEQLSLDPWSRSMHWKNAPPAKLDQFTVCVIGAGMGGLNAAVHLKRAGISFFVVEKNGGVGGTWYENRYPGARVDSPSRTYTHTYGVDFGLPYAFCPQAINLSYFNWIADNFGVRDSIAFNTEVRSVVWDDVAKLWDIKADGPDGPCSWRVNAVITSIGFLSRPNLPAFKGAETFAGPAFHTARWPENLDLTGKRVAVIGSGASGYQLIPELAKVAGQVTLFQRTPSWCFEVPGYLSPHPEQINWMERNFPYFTNFSRLRLSANAGPQKQRPSLMIDPEFKDEHTRSPRNKIIREERINYISGKLAGRPNLIQKMIPNAPPLSYRWVLVDRDYNIYDALMRDNVSLVAEPIEKLTENHIVTADGEEHPVDIIVYATGYKANEFLWPMEVRGRNGQHVEDLWNRDGPRAYLGTMIPGFPNFFMVYGPNSNNFGGLQIVDFQELVTRFSLHCIGEVIENRKASVEVSADAFERYNAELDRCEAQMIYSDPRDVSYYKNAHGRSSANCPIDVRRIWKWLRDPAARNADTPGFDHRAINATAEVIKPYIGEDLILR